jgi:hypothetical protein
MSELEEYRLAVGYWEWWANQGQSNMQYVTISGDATEITFNYTGPMTGNRHLFLRSKPSIRLKIKLWFKGYRKRRDEWYVKKVTYQ